jgi:NADPH-dependent 2,4-dienoyl-CoA reductase/sulfur reductase-like enzyme
MLQAAENAMAASNREVDLLIAGAGPAGMAAALVAALEGLDVLLCEKSDQVGGTGSTSAGTLWIPGNSQSRAAGFSDNAEQADIYLSALVGEATNRELSPIRTNGDRLFVCAHRRAIHSLRNAPGLSQQHAGRCDRRSRHYAGAI